jgi:hypothetical protein
MTPSEVSRLPEYALLNIYQDSTDVSLRVAARDELDRRRRLPAVRRPFQRWPKIDTRALAAGDRSE